MGWTLEGVHPRNSTWNLKSEVPGKDWKRRFVLETIIFRFQVEFRGEYGVGFFFGGGKL